MTTDYDKTIGDYYGHNDKEEKPTSLEDREYFGLKLRHWKQVAKEAALAGGMAYRTIKKTIESERTK